MNCKQLQSLPDTSLVVTQCFIKEYERAFPLACCSSILGVSFFVSFAGSLLLGCWGFLCFICQLVVKFTCHLMCKICTLEESEHWSTWNSSLLC
ncbi:hypothetical protein Q3G72_011983 [Acer saccharum]|nr:hypothetical protein Q3G72_011983 [Acer saccharum]